MLTTVTYIPFLNFTQSPSRRKLHMFYYMLFPQKLHRARWKTAQKVFTTTIYFNQILYLRFLYSPHSPIRTKSGRQCQCDHDVLDQDNFILIRIHCRSCWTKDCNFDQFWNYLRDPVRTHLNNQDQIWHTRVYPQRALTRQILSGSVYYLCRIIRGEYP